MRRKRFVLIVGAICGAILAAWICFPPNQQPGPPISFGFKGYRETIRVRRAVVTLTNHTSAPLRCQGTLGSHRGALEIEDHFDTWLPAHGSGEVGVSADFGQGAGQLCCKLTAITCQRPAWVARLGRLLAPLGVHLYYTSPLPTPFPKIHVGTRAPPGAYLGPTAYPLTVYVDAP